MFAEFFRDVRKQNKTITTAQRVWYTVESISLMAGTVSLWWFISGIREPNMVIKPIEITLGVLASIVLLRLVLISGSRSFMYSKTKETAAILYSLFVFILWQAWWCT